MSNIPSFANTNKSIRSYDVLPSGDYPARITRFVGLGVNEQPDYQGTSKNPAFKAMFEFELIGVDTSGTETKDGETNAIEPTAACQFYDVFLFPGGSRGKVFDLCKVLDPSCQEVPNDLEWFKKALGSVVNVNVGSYKVKNGPNTGKFRNTVKGVSAIPKVFQSQVGEARRDFVFFDPYVETDAMFSAYSDLFRYQREILSDAVDSANIVYAGKEPAFNTAIEQKDLTQAQKTNVSLDEEDIPFSPIGLQYNNGLMHVI